MNNSPHVHVTVSTSSSSSDSNSSTDSYNTYSGKDIDDFEGNAVRYGPDSFPDMIPFREKFINALKRIGLYVYIIMLNVGIPYTIYYFFLDEQTLQIPYWIGYGSLMLTNLFKVIEGILAAIAYFHKKFTKQRRQVIDLQSRNFVEVYETDLKSTPSNERGVVVDGLPVKDDDPDLSGKMAEHMSKIKGDKPTLLVIVAAYLVNERDVIEETLNHMGNVHYKGEANILLCHNSPSFPEKEELIHRLEDLSRGFFQMYGKHLYIAECMYSHSKAENVNYGLDIVKEGIIDKPDIVAMYDADHQPELWSWERVVYMFTKTGCDLIQGRCVIRNNENFFAKMIAVEYELMYTLHQKGGGILRNYGIFGGSNGFWRYDLLAEIGMDESMLTEDIDSNYRALELGTYILYCDDVISYELTPPNLKAWISQRLRWSQGWVEVTSRHTWRILKCNKMTWRQRLLSLIYLPWREISIYLMAQILPSFLLYVIIYGSDGIGWKSILGSVLIKDLPIWINTLLVGACIMNDSHRWYNVQYKPVGMSGYFMFIMFSPIYLQALLYIAMTAHYKHLIGATKWIVTPR